MYKFKSDSGVESGLKIWIAFILGFWLVGFRAELCIFLGAIGGLAIWALVGSWKAEKVDPPKPPEPVQTPEPKPSIGPLGRVLLSPAERFRKLGAGRRLPRLPERKPPKRL